jgi:hypothetical protein
MATDFEPTWALIKKPSNYPSAPGGGKLQLIYGANATTLYHKLSPYSNYSENTGLLTFGTQPFYYIYPDQNNQGLNALKKYESQLYPAGDAPIDVIRVSKFLVSGAGIKFLAKQALLQTGNAYDETRIYNPTSPIIAAGMTLAVGSVRPQRNFDTSGGLSGIIGSLVGSTIETAIFGAPKINPPASTVGSGGLPTVNLTSGGKGLLRAQTANTAKGLLESSWGQTSNAAGFLSSLFANFIPQNQNGVTYRADEEAYGLMINDQKSILSYTDANGSVFDLNQMWVAGGSIMRPNNEYPDGAVRFFKTYNNGVPQQVGFTSDQLSGLSINTVGAIGYSVQQSTNILKPGYRYGDNVGTKQDADYEASDIMVQYGEFANPAETFPTKQTDTSNDISPANLLNTTLKAVLSTLNKTSGSLYSIAVPNDARVISSGQPTSNGYDRLFKTANKNNARTGLNYPLGVLQDYRNNNVSVVTNDLTSNVNDNSKKLPGSGMFDAINTLEVLDSNMTINNSKLKTWNTWSPYNDDLIALYFYDVVNEKYIPFRAAIKGLSEALNATWEEMQFIGRGDKVYSYNGFNRNLSLTINIVISSLMELAPTWQRINYLASMVKPANYTTSNYNGSMNRFMVPPMVMLTLGDMYKDQPLLIQSATITVPDDAVWETQHQIGGEQWKYLANYMTAPSSVLFGQLPRSVDISLGLILLEKERAVVGGANFGHAPRDENLLYWNIDTVPTGGSPTPLHQSWVVTPSGNPVESPNNITDTVPDTTPAPTVAP